MAVTSDARFHKLAILAPMLRQCATGGSQTLVRCFSNDGTGVIASIRATTDLGLAGLIRSAGVLAGNRTLGACSGAFASRAADMSRRLTKKTGAITGEGLGENGYCAGNWGNRL